MKKESKSQSLRSLQSKSGSITRINSFSVKPEDLIIKPEFNARDQFVDDYYEQDHVKEHIRKIAESYKAGIYVDPIVVQVIDDEICVRSGHCRTKALRLAISEGAQIKSIKVNEHSGDEAAQQLLTVTSNDGLPITPLAVAVVYDRLIKYGHSEKDVSSKVGKSVEHVRQTLALLSLPIELKAMIQRNQIASTFASDLVLEYGTEEAVRLAKKALAKSTSDTNKRKKPKVTKAKISGLPRISRNLVQSMHSNFVSLAPAISQAKKEGENYFVELTPDQMEAFKKLQSELEPKKEESAPAQASDQEATPENQSHPVTSSDQKEPVTSSSLNIHEPA